MDKEIFEKQYLLLNEEQRKVVDSIEENILALCPAGTGKTNALALRTANMLLNEVEPEEILCLTFTNKASSEMRDRICRIANEGNNINIKTFHGFCFDVIKAEAKKSTDIPKDFMVLDEEDCKEIISEVNRKGFSLKILEGFIYEVKHHSIKINKEDRIDYKVLVESFMKEKGDEFFERYKREKDLSSVRIALESYGYILYEKYNNILRERHGLDFSDLVIGVYELFEDKEILNDWRERFNYIQIDEVQDTSMLEYEIIKKLSKDKHLSFFGDINQTIYEWRGSKPFEIIEDYTHDFSPVKEITFEINYRSNKGLIEANNSFLINMKKNLFLENSNYNLEEVEEKNILIKEFNTIEEEGNFICDILEEKHMNSLNKAVILTRNNNLNIEYSKILETRRIPGFLVDEFKFFRRKEVKEALAYFKLALNKYDVSSMKRIAVNFVTGVGDRTIEYIESNASKELGIRLTDFIDKVTIENGDPYRLLIDSITEGNLVVFDVESTGVDTTSDEIIQIAAIKLEKNGEVTKFEEFIKPQKLVGSSAKVHGFTDEFLNNNGRKAEVVLMEFLEFIKDKVIVGHNVQYDLSILKSVLKRLSIEEYNIKGYYDTLDLSRKLYPRLKNHKLDTLSAFLNTKQKPSHDAMDDILATKEILFSMIESLKRNMEERNRLISVYRKKFIKLSNEIDEIRKNIIDKRPWQVLEQIYEFSNIQDKYKNEPKRIENLNELYKFFKEGDYEELNGEDSLRRLLTITTLSNSEIDRSISRENKIPIITVHQAKGLEFESVFLCGMNEGDFPSFFNMDNEGLREEARLFYVAITRAKDKLYITNHKLRQGRKKNKSKFVSWIDEKYII